MREQYDRAKAMQPENALGITANVAPVPVFSENGFALKRERMLNGTKCWSFIYVNAQSGQESPLFDHSELARQLSEAAGEACVSDKLDLQVLQAETGSCVFGYRGKTYKYSDGKLTKCPEEEGAVSPNGKYSVQVREHNLWLRNVADGHETQLTFDGELHWDYASRLEGDTSFITDVRAGQKIKPRLIWSPDGEKFITYKLDQRRVKDLHLVQSVPPGKVERPVLHTYKYSMPGDEELATAALYICDVPSRQMIKVDIPDILAAFMTPIHELLSNVCWSDKGNVILCYTMERGFKKASVYRVNPQTGQARKLFDEVTDTFLFFDFFHLMQSENTECTGNALAPIWGSEAEDALLWISNRSGWHQLYAYDLETGAQKAQVTKGQFEVCQVYHVDWEEKKVFFSAMGLQEDPYDRSLCVCSLDGSEMKVLSEQKGNHIVSFAPKGDYYTDLLTESDLLPQLSLHRRDGSCIKVLTECDAQALEQNGFIRPIRFNLPGADGETRIFGTLLIPKEAKGKIPVVDYYYGGTQHINTPHTFQGVVASSGFVECIAQLGIACVVLDGKGTPGRGKHYHDACYRRQGDCAGLEDHVSVLHQLCRLYPVLDEERIGVWGHSGGGYAAVHCLTKHGETYKCGVSSGGNHRQEIYLADWSERFMGLFDQECWEQQSAENLVKKLDGSLLLIHGELDDNVHPANTMRIVNALVEANKDFELLILPNYAHALRPSKYFRRRILDFFTVHLLNETPPKEYCL